MGRTANRRANRKHKATRILISRNDLKQRGFRGLGFEDRDNIVSHLDQEASREIDDILAKRYASVSPINEKYAQKR
jgi:hypothetical protein